MLPKIILVGYPGSQKIVNFSKYLTSKYLPMFDVTYLNYNGEIDGWSKYVVNYLSKMSDEKVIFSLDDYLISGDIDMDTFLQAEAEVQNEVVCAKLCQSTEEEHLEYPVTTQYCVWNRKFLINVLGMVNTPWEFELKGSSLFKSYNEWDSKFPNGMGVKVILRTCIPYFANSSISSRWEGVNLSGLKQEDIDVYNNWYPKIVVFGGSGYLGQALIERLISLGHSRILSVSRNEGSLVALKERFPEVSVMVGDIQDPSTVMKAMVDAQDVYILSAMKHVGLAEKEVRSCVNTNIIGTMNIINESLVNRPALVVFISSDKASQPSGVYGASKKIGERLMVEAAETNPDTKYRVIRYGNVWGSTGSIVTKWRPKMERGEEVILTDAEATRFFWTVDEAVDLIFECKNRAKSAEPYIPKMKSAKMGVVLEACMEAFGKSPVKHIGLQPGENRHETMDGITFSDSVEQFTKEEFLRKFLKYEPAKS